PSMSTMCYYCYAWFLSSVYFKDQDTSGYSHTSVNWLISTNTSCTFPCTSCTSFKLLSPSPSRLIHASTRFLSRKTSCTCPTVPSVVDSSSTNSSSSFIAASGNFDIPVPFSESTPARKAGGHARKDPRS